jgi:hypothetical protein
MSEQNTEVVIEDESSLASSGDEKVTKPSREDQIEEELTRVRSEVQEQGMMARLLADSDIQQVLAAKQKGQKLKIIAGEDASEPVEKAPANLSDLSPEQLTEHIVKKAAKVVETSVDAKLNDIKQMLSGLQGFVQQSEGEKVDGLMKKAQEEHRDFDAYRTEMINIAKKHPGHTPEELYALAKLKRGVLFADREEAQVESERPSGTQTERENGKREKMKPGARGFDEHLMARLEKLTFPKGFHEPQE